MLGDNRIRSRFLKQYLTLSLSKERVRSDLRRFQEPASGGSRWQKVLQVQACTSRGMNACRERLNKRGGKRMQAASQKPSPPPQLPYLVVLSSTHLSSSRLLLNSHRRPDLVMAYVESPCAKNEIASHKERERERERMGEGGRKAERGLEKNR